MTPAPDTGRTAEEMVDVLRGMRGERDSWKELAAENAIAADRYAREVAHLRAENANLRDRVRDAEKGGQEMMCEAAAMVCDGLADGAAHSLQESAPEDAERWEAVKLSAESLAATIRSLALSPEPQEAGDGR